MPLHIFDDDAGLRNDAVADCIMQHRDLADRPSCEMARRRTGIQEVHGLGPKIEVVLIKGDQHLVAECCERVEIKGQRHEWSS